jgi:nucleotide-binding universal stress UspA family protein
MTFGPQGDSTGFEECAGVEHKHALCLGSEGAMAETILCPLDLHQSEAAQLVAGYAAPLAEALGATLRAVHVYDLPGYIHPDPESPAAKTYERTALGSLRERSHALTEAVAGFPEVQMLPGVPHRRITEEAVRLGASLIVMGTHGRHGLARVVLGSVAERVVRTSTVPVLTVPTSTADLALPTSLLVPDDASEPAHRALEEAKRVGERLGAKIAVVHVMPEELEEDVESAPWPWLSAELRAEYRGQARDRIVADIERVFGDETGVPLHLKHGMVPDEVLAAQSEFGADLVVMGTSGKNAVTRLLLGSAAAEVLRRSSVPVLVVP